MISKFCLKFLFLIATWFMYFSAFSQKYLGNGFYDHGPTSKIAYQRGIVATTDGTKNIILSWLFDHRGGFGLLMLDAHTGKSEQFYPPHPIEGDAQYASLLSKDNKYYTLFNGYFSEFDPIKKHFSFSQKTFPRAAMAMLEDEDGNIWAATYPKCGLIKFNPANRELQDYGSQNQENWAQYPKHMAIDKFGWIYIALGSTRNQIVAFDTKTGKAQPLFEEKERAHGMPYLYRGTDGVIYAKADYKISQPWFILSDGKYIKKENIRASLPEYIRTGNQNFVHRQFPNGDLLKDFDLTTKHFTIKSGRDSTLRTVKFDYETEGSWSLGVNAGPDGKLYGGTAFPMQMYIYEPETNIHENFSEYSQLNAMITFNNKIFSGGYPQGDLIQYTPSVEWIDPISKKINANPKYLFRCSPSLNRPNRIKGLSDQKTIVLAGTPDYGYTGGGLLFYNLNTLSGELLKHDDVVFNQSTMSIAELPGNRILGGTTVNAGTGGEVKASKATLYIMDVKTKKIEWQDSLISNAKSYNDLCVSHKGVVYGFVNSNIFFAFDPTSKKMIVTESIAREFERTTGEQCQRIFVKDKKDDIYILFRKKIGKINQQTHEIGLVAESPVEITAGGDYLNGKIYFISDSHICSYKVD